MPGRATKLILASKSAARQAMLRGAGLRFDTRPANLDEQFFIQALQQKKETVTEIAQKLAEAKALSVAEKSIAALVIGADQVLEFEGRIFSKANNTEDARATLRALRGKTHTLISAVALVQGEKVLWRHADRAHLTMHDFDDEFLDAYCAKAGKALTDCVGCYALEGAGAWLFSKVEGDYFTVLGMPLLPLLAFLRKNTGFRP
jgi:septum formation protein